MDATPTSPNHPKRLLSIDGGGLLGLIPAQALIAIEKQLNEITGQPAPLCERFDLIGGTSTGAILAAGLALGKSAQELSDFYVQLGPKIFDPSFILTRFWHKYPSGPIEKCLKEKLGAAVRLGGPELKTKILLITKNVTLGNNWLFTNNAGNKYFDNNKDLFLCDIVRASSAAPTYFPPHTIQIPDGQAGPNEYEFIDGGVSSYNNPSLQVFLEATQPEHKLNWPTGAGNLLLISLGTGFDSVGVPQGKAARYELLDWAHYMIRELMNEANLQQNVLMHLIGERVSLPTGAPDPALAAAPPGTPDLNALNHVTRTLESTKLLTYQRITVEFGAKRLAQLGLPDVDPAKVREMDAVEEIDNMRRVGQAVAKEQVHMERLKHFFV
jgi:predicted acylesterase/phospholipase RssA